MSEEGRAALHRANSRARRASLLTNERTLAGSFVARVALRAAWDPLVLAQQEAGRIEDSAPDLRLTPSNRSS